MTDTSNKIELKDVSFSYNPGTPLEVRALKDVSLAFEKGKITGIAGHTGSGKSTVVRLLNGLEKPTSGKVLLDGRNIWEEPKKIGSVRFRVGLVMQYPEYQLFEETVRKDIAYGPTKMGLGAEDVENRIKKSAEIVGLSEDELDASPFDLSGGQKRRAAIAGIMAMNPEVLVLDEPAAGLDPEGRNLIFNAIRKYRDENDATVIIVSHSMENLTEFCDRVAVLKNGEVAICGTMDEIFANPALIRSAGLEVPEITALAEKLISLGTDIGTGVYRTDDCAERVVALFKALGEGKV